MFITLGNVADIAITAGQTNRAKGHQGIITFIAERGMPGFRSRELHGKLGMRGTALGELIFENCPVPHKSTA